MEPAAVLVVGTTPDYIAKLHRGADAPLVFLTDVRFKGDPRLGDIPPSVLVFSCLLESDETMLSALPEKPKITGVACFDCESLLVACRLARRLQLPFPPWQAVIRSRNKFEARRTWTATGVSSPFASLSSNLDETLAFFHHHGENIVVKPLSGSGSELLFHCSKEGEVRDAVKVMEEELPKRRTNPLFYSFPDPVRGHLVDPCRSWVAEEFVSGEEFSCDFVYRHGEVILIRETGKVKAPEKPFGSVLAYTFPPLYPEGFHKERLLDLLRKAVQSLGFDWGFFMADYIVRGGLPVLIELTPRPGGDSIPDLVKVGAGLDTLNLYLRFVTRRFQASPPVRLRPQAYASINLYAPQEGVLAELDGSRIRDLARAKHLFFKKERGDRIVLPPRDYDNRLLGYCIVELDPETELIAECRRLEALLTVSLIPFPDPSPLNRRDGEDVRTRSR